MNNRIQKLLYRPFFIRLLHWEYWSFNTVYALIMPVWALLSLRARSFFFFAASNPTIENGGFLMESKKKIYDLMPTAYYPKTVFFTVGTPAEKIVATLQSDEFTYPLIAKPDIGGRGRGVKKLEDETALLAYIQNIGMDFLIQEFAEQPQEVGIFYYRYPNASNGTISGIVRKEMLTVTGDGHSTIAELIQKDKRYILQMEELVRVYAEGLTEILPAGCKKELLPYGNHARGAKFLDDSALADATLIESIDTICKQVEGFYYGRLDIRYHSWEELRLGKNISIIEMNGAGSEPTHIYDPKHSLFFAWKEIIRHWLILYKISRMNHQKGVPYLTHKQGVQMMRANKAFEQKLNALYV